MANPEVETFDRDGLIAGDYPVQAMEVTIVSGQTLTRGAVVGAITASGKYTLSATAAGDGSETARGVLAADADASGGDVTAPVYFSGEFDAGKCSFGTGHSAATANGNFRSAAAPVFLITPALP